MERENCVSMATLGDTTECAAVDEGRRGFVRTVSVAAAVLGISVAARPEQPRAW